MHQAGDLYHHKCLGIHQCLGLLEGREGPCQKHHEGPQLTAWKIEQRMGVVDMTMYKIVSQQ